MRLDLQIPRRRHKLRHQREPEKGDVGCVINDTALVRPNPDIRENRMGT